MKQSDMIQIRLLALLKARRSLGSTENMGSIIGAKRTQINQWCSRGGNIPLHYAIRIHLYTGIPLQELIPQWMDIVNYINVCKSSNQLTEVIVSGLEKQVELAWLHRVIYPHVLMDVNYQVITGYQQLSQAEKDHVSSINVLCVDIKSIALKASIALNFSISERIAIGEYMILQIKQKEPFYTQLWQHFSEETSCKHRTAWVAHILSLGSHAHYQYMRTVLKRGSAELIIAMNQMRITPHQAYQQLS